MTAPAIAAPSCPVCHGPMWDQKAGKYPWKPGTPIFKCRDKACAQQGGVIWEPKNGKPVEQEQAPTPRILQESPRLTLELIGLHHACFKQAMSLAVEAEKMGIGSDLNAVSALTAQLFIAATKS